jgi:hypothetical protein
VGLWDLLKSALGFGGGAGSVDRGLYIYIRCNRCQDVVQVRLNMANDVQQEYVENSDDVAGFTVTKGVVDSKCFRPMTLTMRFDRRRNELEREVEGGEFVERDDWESVRAARRESQQSGGASQE